MGGCFPSPQRRTAGLSRRRILGALAATPFLRHARALAAEPRFRGLDKAMWVWEDRILKPENLAAFVEAHNFRTLFLYTTPTAAEALLNGDAAVRDAVLSLRSTRRLYAMAGEPDWALGPNAIPEHLGLLVRLQASKPRLFDGIHLDVEPNAVEDWKEPAGKAKLIEGTIKFYDLVRQHTDHPIDAAVNPVFARLQTMAGDNFLSALARRVHSISLMAYRNRVQSTLAWAAPAVRMLPSQHPWRMGVEVEPNEPEPNTSWNRYSRSDFEAGMVELDREIRQRFKPSGYAGLALHSFDGLRSKMDRA
jgi:hypothetical protein